MPMPATAMPVGVLYQGSSTTMGGTFTWGGLMSTGTGATATVDGLTALRAARVAELTLLVFGATLGDTAVR